MRFASIAVTSAVERCKPDVFPKRADGPAPAVGRGFLHDSDGGLISMAYRLKTFQVQIVADGLNIQQVRRVDHPRMSNE